MSTQSNSLFGLATEWTVLEGLIESAYEQTAPPDNATPEELAEYEAQRKAVDDALLQELLSHDDAVSVKVDRYCSLIREREARGKARRAEADRIAALAKADAAIVTRLKAALQMYMETTGQEKIGGVRFNVALQPNGGVPPLLLDEGLDPSHLDARWIRTTIAIDTEAIRKELAAGGKLCFARLGNAGKHVRIR